MSCPMPVYRAGLPRWRAVSASACHPARYRTPRRHQDGNPSGLLPPRRHRRCDGTDSPLPGLLPLACPDSPTGVSRRRLPAANAPVPHDPDSFPAAAVSLLAGARDNRVQNCPGCGDRLFGLHRCCDRAVPTTRRPGSANCGHSRGEILLATRSRRPRPRRAATTVSAGPRARRSRRCRR
jgi:hypothetical protein